MRIADQSDTTFGGRGEGGGGRENTCAMEKLGATIYLTEVLAAAASRNPLSFGANSIADISPGMEI